MLASIMLAPNWEGQGILLEVVIVLTILLGLHQGSSIRLEGRSSKLEKGRLWDCLFKFQRIRINKISQVQISIILNFRIRQEILLTIEGIALRLEI